MRVKARDALGAAGYLLMVALLVACPSFAPFNNRVTAEGAVTNLSNLLPAGEGTGYDFIDSNFGQVVAKNGKGYTAWAGENGATGYDIYLYNGSTNETKNLSSRLSGSDGGGDALFSYVKIFSDSSPLVAWSEKDSVGSSKVYIYDGRTDSIIDTESLMVGEPAGNTGWIPDFEIGPTDTYFITFHRDGKRGGYNDAFVYKSTTGTVVNMSDLMPVGQGGGNAYLTKGNTRINSSGEAFIVFDEMGASSYDAQLYDSATNTVTNLSALRSAGATGHTSYEVLRLDPSTGKPYVLWPESTATLSAMPYLYNGNTGTVTNLMELYGPPTNYDDIYLNYTEWEVLGLTVGNSGDAYVTWGGREIASGKYYPFFYNGNSGAVTNLSATVSSDYTSFGSTEIAMGADDKPVIAFSAWGSSVGSDLYYYRFAADTSTKVDDGESISRIYFVPRPGKDPVLVWRNWDDIIESHRTHDPDTGTTTNINNLVPGSNVVSWIYSFAIANDKLVAAVPLDVAGQEDMYYYDGRTGSITNMRTLMKPGEGLWDTGYATITTDENGQVFLVWQEGSGERGNVDMYMYHDIVLAPPTITSVSPTQVSVGGGTTVTITGTNFTPSTTVTIGGVSVIPTYVNSSTLTATAPAHATGAVSVSVANAGSTSTLTNSLTYYSAIEPNPVQPVSTTPIISSESGLQTTATSATLLSTSSISVDAPTSSGTINVPPETKKPSEPINSYSVPELAKANIFQRILSSPSTPFVYPVIFLAVSLVVIAILLWRIYREFRHAHQIIEILKQEAETARDKTNFLQLGAHFLRTPVAIISAASQMVNAIPGLQANTEKKLVAVTASLTKAVENILANTQQDNRIADIVEPDLNSIARRVYSSPIFWLPVVLSIILTFVMNLLITYVGHQQTPNYALLEQATVIGIIGLLFYGVARGSYMQKTRKAELQKQLDQRIRLDATKNDFIQSVIENLSQNIFTLVKLREEVPSTGAISNSLIEGIHRLESLVNKFSILISIKSGNLAVSTLSSSQLINDAYKSASQKIADKNLKVIKRGQDIQFLQNRILIEQVVSSVLDNAAEFSDPGSKIVIDNLSHKDKTVLRVTNEGPGFSQDPQKLFGLFKRGANAEDFTHAGIGLSLYLDMLILRRLGGNIVARNTANGAEVTIVT